MFSVENSNPRSCFRKPVKMFLIKSEKKECSFFYEIEMALKPVRPKETLTERIKCECVYNK